MVQTQMLRAVALAFDKGLLFGTGVAPQPLGVANTPGILAETDVPLTSLAGFASAIGDLIATNAVAGALVMNPLDLGTLLGLTEDADSNVPLWKLGDLRRRGPQAPLLRRRRSTSRPHARRAKPCSTTPPRSSRSSAEHADVAVDPYYGFDNGEIGLRAYVRGHARRRPAHRRGEAHLRVMGESYHLHQREAR